MGMCCVTCHFLDPTQQLYITTPTEFQTQDGPGFFVLGPGKSGSTRAATTLGPTEYLKIEHNITGELRNFKGPGVFFPGPYDKVVARREATALQINQYVKLMDTLTGRIRVERGEALVYVSPTEEVIGGGRKNAVQVDEETAVLVRNTETGQQFLVTEQQLFFPSAYEEIASIRHLIKLADYETAVVRDRDGRYLYYTGMSDEEMAAHQRQESKAAQQDGGGAAAAASATAAAGGAVGESASSRSISADVVFPERSFFLPPYCELVELRWSGGPRKESQNIVLHTVDRRPQFMNYEFLCRTSDNVELQLDITLFWQVVSVPQMMLYTDDAPGNICHHARSEIIQHVSQVSLEQFMTEFNTIVTAAVIESGDSFYRERGVHIHTVEVRQFSCSDKSTERVLQAIIQETTNRMNRLQKQESENEVRIFALRGEIEEEKLKGGLLDVRHDHNRRQARMEGEAESDRVRAFIGGLAETVPDLDTRVDLFRTLRRVEVLDSLSQGPAHLYFTPNDVNLSIKSTAPNAAAPHATETAAAAAAAGAAAAAAGAAMATRGRNSSSSGGRSGGNSPGSKSSSSNSSSNRRPASKQNKTRSAVAPVDGSGEAKQG